MKLEELLESNLTAEDCLYAVYNWGSDPVYVEYKEDAQQIAEFLNALQHAEELEKDTEDWEIAVRQLSLEDNNPSHIFVLNNYNEEAVKVCFYEDYEY